MAPILLGNSCLRTAIDPEQGTSLHSFEIHREDTWLSLMPRIGDPACDLAAASFLMVPYSNRIANGAFAFAGRSYQLANAEQHAIHGDVRNRPWVVAEKTPQRLVCTFDSTDHDEVNWPWPFAVCAEYQLSEQTLQQRLRLWNRGDGPMPAGFGWHPFFNRTRIPSGPTQPLAVHQDFSNEKPLARENFLDTCFHGYQGRGSITWPTSGIRLHFACSSAASHLILYNPADKPYFAVEPVTNANDGVNLYDRRDPTSGIAVLEPDQSLEASFDLRVELTRI